MSGITDFKDGIKNLGKNIKEGVSNTSKNIKENVCK